jgi:uncharacterized protein YjiS (DUF1127 family)
MAFINDLQKFETTITDRIHLAFAALQKHRVRRAAYRQTHDELSQLTDRELNDLGFSRADIPAIAASAAKEAA